LPGVSEKVLTEQLRQLEADGIVRRTVLPSVPPRVDYELTEAGRELIPIMKTMCAWASTYLGVEPNFPPNAAALLLGVSLESKV
jgi:DNA-binding HxlR family transcriptional regulator